MSRIFNRFIVTLLVVIALSFSLHSQTFKHEQSRYPRVKSAIAEKDSLLKALCASKNIFYPPSKIFIRIFKHEQLLEVWAKDKSDNAFTLLKEYNICSSSGTIGPKRKQGDGQVPEGFYVIDAFNPNSSFHLSMRINYPNASDRILGKKGSLGNDICIHGNCVTIGCVPITDDKIKEVYLLAVEAKSAGQQQIPVYIFPARMSDDGMKMLTEFAAQDTALLKFWKNVKEGYDFFEAHQTLPKISVKKDGAYSFLK